MAQVTERGCTVAEVSQRPAVISHSPYAWKQRFAAAVDLKPSSPIRRASAPCNRSCAKST
ncbi:MAG: hypothetical protein DI527_10920 [Chelatococcus sp.]|nr:MAG: hypothetical protein DI527_10920 [Chelatococcus sp.]